VTVIIFSPILSLVRCTRWHSYSWVTGHQTVSAPTLMPFWRSLSCCLRCRGEVETNQLWSMEGEK